MATVLVSAEMIDDLALEDNMGSIKLKIEDLMSKKCYFGAHRR
jgi:hypothetical protein